MAETLRNELAKDLAETLSRNWWILLLRGLLGIAFGVLTFMQPAVSLAWLVLIFGAFAMADGILNLWTAFTDKESENRWLLGLGGLVGIGVGLLTFLAPGVTAIALLFYIALWAMVMGVLEIVIAIRLRKEIEGEWLLGLAGLCSLVFGVALLARPAIGALAVLWLIAAYAIVFGVIFTVLAFKVKGLAKKV
jgi:uncharacterized membrane protein HdeD (DUF308 family)